jgi:hypothetical protein
MWLILTPDQKPVCLKNYISHHSGLTRAPRPMEQNSLYGKEGHYYVYDIATKSHINITEKLKTSFVNTEDDHNVTKPLTPAIGWSLDNKYVLIRDLWDIWQIPVNGKEAAVNLTVNGRKEKTRYQSRFTLDADEKGIDLKKPQYIRTYGEWNKKSGIARLEPGKAGLAPGTKTLLWEDASINWLSKAKKIGSVSVWP